MLLLDAFSAELTVVQGWPFRTHAMPFNTIDCCRATETLEEDGFLDLPVI
jgi:hypothetical protein